MSEASGAVRPKATKDSDFYQTPEIAVEALFYARDNFILPSGSFARNEMYHDPCAGQKAIGNVFRKHNQSLTESDIDTGVDFLKDNNSYQNIIANPPYSLKSEFIKHALEIAEETVIMILPYNVGNYNSFHDEFLDNPKFMGKLKLSPKFFMTKDYQVTLDKRGGVSSYAWYFWSRYCATTTSWEAYMNLDELVKKGRLK